MFLLLGTINISELRVAMEEEKTPNQEFRDYVISSIRPSLNAFDGILSGTLGPFLTYIFPA